MNTVALEVDYASDIAFCASCRLACAAERLRAVQGKSGHGGGPASLWRESGRYESIGSEMPEALPDKESTLLVYCRSGRRSKDAAEKLLALGYQSVYDFGGVIDWPYELVKEG